jgi:hydrogenase maturation protein HypF
VTLGRAHNVATIVLSGGVFQNELLLRDVKSLLAPEHFQIWTNHVVPANDGGVSLGQAALAVFGTRNAISSLEEAKVERSIEAAPARSV